MPTYEYHCTQCKRATEIVHKITEDPIKVCPACGHETLRRGPGGGNGLLFKGTGFYKTDYDSSKPLDMPESSAKSGGCCPCGKPESCSK